MRMLFSISMWIVGVFVGLLSAFAAAPATAAVFTQPMNSSPIALSADQQFLWVVNPRDDSVSVIRTDNNTVIATIGTGDEPRSVALDPNNTFAYVADAAGGSVTIIRITKASFSDFTAEIDRTIVTGSEPWDIVISPDGKRVFVANSAQDTITVINAQTRTIIGRIDLRNSLCNDPDRTRRFQPRGMGVTLANSQLYVTRFLSYTRASGGRQGVDEGKEGAVCRIAIDTSATSISGYTPAQLITFAPRATGFNVDRTGDGVPDSTTAFPNQMQSFVLRGNKGFMPNIAASPTSPLVFNTSTQAFVTIMNNVGVGVPGDGGRLNLHLGARNPEPGKKKLFFANPWAIAFTTQVGSGNAYVVSAGSDLLVKLKISAADNLSFTVDADTTRYIDLNDPANPATSGANAGKNPVGIVISANGTRAYVANNVSGNVSVVNTATDSVIKVVQTGILPPSGSLTEIVNVGAEMFFSSRGNFNRPSGTTVSTSERLSSEGWQNCASCHFNGWTDGVVWQFGAGPRKSVSLAGTFNPRNRAQQKVLNYSAIFDEVEDFEANIRNVSGPGPLAAAIACANGLPSSTLDPNHGLLIGDNGSVNTPPCVLNQFVKANANRSEMTVNPVGATAAVEGLTALREWVRRGVRVPNAPLDSSKISGGPSASDITAGRALFQQQCAVCHKGGQWIKSVKNFTSPPANSKIACEVDLGAGAPAGSACSTAPLIGNPIGLQYLNEFLEDVGSFNLGVPGGGNLIGANIGAAEKAAATLVAGVAQAPRDALGRDYNGDGRGVGYNVQSLLGAQLTPPFMHNGACESIACVVGDVKHRTGNGRFADLLNTTTKRRQVRLFVESIDDSTSPF
jgi:YVTN family beta-propeller protein